MLKNSCHSSHSSGFTLIEVMISLALGLFLLAMGMQALLLINKTFIDVKQSARMQETARFAFELLRQDLKQSSYWADVLSFSEISGSLNVSDINLTSCLEGGNSWGKQLQQSIYGLNDSASSYACVSNDDYLNGDILTVRYPELQASFNIDNEQLYLRSNGTEHRLFLGADKNLVSNTNLALATITQQIISHSFYVGDSKRRCNGHIVPSLYWQTLVNGRPQQEELLSGVEQLQLQFGVDQDLDSSPEQYLNPSQVINWQQISSIKVDLLVRSKCPDLSHKDNNLYVLGDIQYQPKDNFHRQFYSYSFNYKH